jgi:hypothetical protein
VKLRQEVGGVFVNLDLLAQSLGSLINEAAAEVFDAVRHPPAGSTFANHKTTSRLP